MGTSNFLSLQYLQDGCYVQYCRSAAQRSRRHLRSTLQARTRRSSFKSFCNKSSKKTRQTKSQGRKRTRLLTVVPRLEDGWSCTSRFVHTVEGWKVKYISIS